MTDWPPAGIDWSRAVVAEMKLTGYLLELAHADGGSKARFFRAFGYTEANTPALAEALRRQAATATVRSDPHELGIKFVADGDFIGADSRRRRLRSVWVLDRGTEHPRLITAHPLEERRDRRA